MNFKDLFSAQAAQYAQFRPHYPQELFAWVASLPPQRRLAVDIGTGNGQAAVALAPHFGRVIGVDPSAQQIASAAAASGVEYRVGRAEATGVEPASANLITVAQAFHWFDRPAFFREVRRICVPDGRLALWCYGLTTITPEIDAVVSEYYEDMLGPFWEPERRLVENGYRTIEVPFEEIPAPSRMLELGWTLEQLVGYLGTWSPRKPYQAAHGVDALEAIFPKLERAWGGAGERLITWPLSVRAFRV
jgi:ubiquinone/menaquinone biosynthesis C-methylase UbiE